MTPAARKTKTVTDGDSLEDRFKSHLSFKVQGAKLTALAEKLKKDFKKTMESVWDDENENGSRFTWLKETVKVDGVNYKGMELRRSEGTTHFDEDIATAILTEKKLLRKAQSLALDQDKVRLLNQKGDLTDDELDRMYPVGDPTWAFWAVKGEVE